MKFFKKIILAMVMLSIVGSFAACERKGPMERAGEKVDKGAEKTKDAVKDATH
jgi:predicted small lipoprotein YifL